MKEEISLEQYADDLLNKLITEGATKDDSTTVDFALQKGDIKFIVDDKDGIKRLYIIRKFEKIYAVIFQIAVKENFDKYIREYKKDLETILADIKLKV